jgi:hypothetical protein
MALNISVCGILACPRVERNAWQTRFSWTAVAEPDARVAKEFIELEVDTEGFAIGETDTDLLVATIHPGHIEHSALITHADMPVTEVDAEWWETQTWTVCGIFADNGQCYSGLWAGCGPLVAYGCAWHHFQRQGRELLVAGAHLTDGVEVPVERAAWSPTFADPTCLTEEAMRSRLAELIPG